MKLLMILTFASVATYAATDPFARKDGCFLLYDVKADKMVEEINPKRCKVRLPPCSTFKFPLALMAFDSGVLPDEKTVLKWDGKREAREALNKDHDARSWMKDSVLWFSQRLTPLLGEQRLRRYLKDFDYGNQDISAGLTRAWVVAPDAPETPLAISAYEQLEFLKKFWRGKLRVSDRALKLTRDITYIETSPEGWVLHGKTGSNSYDKKPQLRLGWFVSHLKKGDQEYLTVMNFSDTEPPVGDAEAYGGLQARAMTKDMLRARHLW